MVYSSPEQCTQVIVSVLRSSLLYSYSVQCTQALLSVLRCRYSDPRYVYSRRPDPLLHPGEGAKALPLLGLALAPPTSRRGPCQYRGKMYRGLWLNPERTEALFLDVSMDCHDPQTGV